MVTSAKPDWMFMSDVSLSNLAGVITFLLSFSLSLRIAKWIDFLR